MKNLNNINDMTIVNKKKYKDSMLNWIENKFRKNI